MTTFVTLFAEETSKKTNRPKAKGRSQLEGESSVNL